MKKNLIFTKPRIGRSSVVSKRLENIEIFLAKRLQ